MAVGHRLEVGMRCGGRSMSFPRAHQVVAVQIKKHLSGAHRPDNVRIDICHCIAGDLERERPAARMSIFLAELVKVISYLTVSVGQTHVCSYTLAAASSSATAVSRIAARCTVVSFRT